MAPCASCGPGALQRLIEPFSERGGGLCLISGTGLLHQWSNTVSCHRGHWRRKRDRGCDSQLGKVTFIDAISTQFKQNFLGRKKQRPRNRPHRIQQHIRNPSRRRRPQQLNFPSNLESARSQHFGSVDIQLLAPSNVSTLIATTQSK